MTFKYNNVYINETSTVVGPYEHKGPLSKYYDSSYEDLYFGEKTWEKGESVMQKKALEQKDKEVKEALKQAMDEYLKTMLGSDVFYYNWFFLLQ